MEPSSLGNRVIALRKHMVNDFVQSQLTSMSMQSTSLYYFDDIYVTVLSTICPKNRLPAHLLSFSCRAQCATFSKGHEYPHPEDQDKIYNVPAGHNRCRTWTCLDRDKRPLIDVQSSPRGCHVFSEALEGPYGWSDQRMMRLPIVSTRLCVVWWPIYLR